MHPLSTVSGKVMKVSKVDEHWPVLNISTFHVSFVIAELKLEFKNENTEKAVFFK